MRQPEAAKVARWADRIGSCHKAPNSHRKRRRTCGGHIFIEHPGMGLTDVSAAVIPVFPYNAGIHVHYQQAKLRIKDGLPNLKDVPEEMSGSGITLPE